MSALISVDHMMSSLCRHKDLLLQELVSLSAEEVYTILCLPAMSQEHVLTSPLPEGRHLATVPLPLYSTRLCSSHRPWHYLDATTSSCRHQLPYSSATAGIHPETGGDFLQQHWGPPGLPPQMLTDHDGEVRSADSCAWPVSRGSHFSHAPGP